MKVSAKTDVTINLGQALGVSRSALLRGVRAATIEAKTLTIQELSQPGQGATRRNGSKASAPGEPPAPDTGRLRGSTQSEVRATTGGLAGTVSVNAEYAAALELGTETIAPRPYLSTVAKKYSKRLIEVFTRFARG